jgi:hypothetical protein
MDFARSVKSMSRGFVKAQPLHSQQAKQMIVNFWSHIAAKTW